MPFIPPLHRVLNLFAFCLFVVADVDFIEYDLLFCKLLCLFSLFSSVLAYTNH